MGKLYKLNINLDPERISKALRKVPPTEQEREEYVVFLQKWEKENPKTRGEQPKLESRMECPREFFKDMIMLAMRIVHKKGNYNRLVITREIAKKMDQAIETDGFLILADKQFEFIKNVFYKCDEWFNQEEIAKSLETIDEVFKYAEVVE